MDGTCAKSANLRQDQSRSNARRSLEQAQVAADAVGAIVHPRQQVARSARAARADHQVARVPAMPIARLIQIQVGVGPGRRAGDRPAKPITTSTHNTHHGAPQTLEFSTWIRRSWRKRFWIDSTGAAWSRLDASPATMPAKAMCRTPNACSAMPAASGPGTSRLLRQQPRRAAPGRCRAMPEAPCRTAAGAGGGAPAPASTRAAVPFGQRVLADRRASSACQADFRSSSSIVVSMRSRSVKVRRGRAGLRRPILVETLLSGDAEDLGDLALRAVVEVEQQQGAVERRLPLDEALEHARTCWSRSWSAPPASATSMQPRRPAALHHGAPPHDLLAHVADRHVQRHAIHPGAEAARRVVLRPRVPELRADVLHQGRRGPRACGRSCSRP